jgi:predicted Zn-dependent protease
MNSRSLMLSLLLALSGAHIAAAAEAAPKPLGSAVDYLTVADIAVQLKDWKKAEQIIRDGMAAHPDSDGFHLSLGYVLENQGHIAEAFYEYQYEILRSSRVRMAEEAARKSAALLARKSADADEPRRVMAALQLAENDPAAARKAIAAVSRTRGDRFALRVFEVECAQRAGDLDGAEKGFRALLARDPGFIPGYVALADLLASSGHAAEAEAILATAQQRGAGHWALEGRAP